MIKAQCLWDVAIKMKSSLDSTNVLVASLKPLLGHYGHVGNWKMMLNEKQKGRDWRLMIFANWSIFNTVHTFRQLAVELNKSLYT